MKCSTGERRFRFAVILSLFLHTYAANSQSYGSVLLPRDVGFDKKTRNALQNIRDPNASPAQKQPFLQELTTSGDSDKATLTLIGYKGGEISDQINQDRAFVVSPFFIREGKEGQLLGVFDGHGNLGEMVSEYTLQEVPKRLAEKLEVSNLDDDDEVVRALKETFEEIDSTVPTQGEGGCTASVVLRIGTKIYVANTGDSISFLSIYIEANNEQQIIFMTREDKPHLADERERIERMGGTVYIPSDLAEESSRVVHYDYEAGYQTTLAMSRSIGDWMMVGVIAEPLVEVIDLEELVSEVVEQVNSCTEGDMCLAITADSVHLFAASATDGMIDFVTPEYMSRAFATAFYQPSKNKHPLTTAEDLIILAAQRWNQNMGGQYRDDIAVAAAKLQL